MAKGSTLQATAATVKRTTSGAGSGSKKASVVLGGGASSSTTSTTSSKATKKRDAQKALESIAVSPRRGSKKASSKQADINDDEEDITEVDVDGNHLRRLKPEDKRYKAYLQDTLRKNLGEKLGLLHAEDQDTVEKILKAFDLNADYGPAVGMTRLDRWNRASTWGLNPPAEVHDILTTIEGDKQVKYRESLFYERF